MKDFKKELDAFLKTTDTSKEIEELNIYNFEECKKSAEMLKEKGAKLQYGTVHAFETRRGCYYRWYVFVDDDCEQSYTIYAVGYSISGKPMWCDRNILDKKNEAWKDILSYMEERYSVIAFPKSEEFNEHF